MGEWAEMMLDGTMCQVCGEFMGGAGDGFPVTCPGCAKADKPQRRAAPAKKIKCPICEKRVKVAGLADHQRDVHRVVPPEERKHG